MVEARNLELRSRLNVDFMRGVSRPGKGETMQRLLYVAILTSALAAPATTFAGTLALTFDLTGSSFDFRIRRDNFGEGSIPSDSGSATVVLKGVNSLGVLSGATGAVSLRSLTFARDLIGAAVSLMQQGTAVGVRQGAQVSFGAGAFNPRVGLIASYLNIQGTFFNEQPFVFALNNTDMPGGAVLAGSILGFQTGPAGFTGTFGGGPPASFDLHAVRVTGREVARSFVPEPSAAPMLLAGLFFTLAAAGFRRGRGRTLG